MDRKKDRKQEKETFCDHTFRIKNKAEQHQHRMAREAGPGAAARWVLRKTLCDARGGCTCVIPPRARSFRRHSPRDERAVRPSPLGDPLGRSVLMILHGAQRTWIASVCRRASGHFQDAWCDGLDQPACRRAHGLRAMRRCAAMPLSLPKSCMPRCAISMSCVATMPRHYLNHGCDNAASLPK